ncbi:MAG: SIMPL domain-containing protein [Alphaproteobacteria bacterium]
MKRHLSTLLAAALVIAVSAACSAPAENNTSDDAPQRLLTVNGHGEARHAPDMATISAGVRTHAATAQDALRANTGAMNKVFATMKPLGIADADMQTSNFSVQPVYQQTPPGMPQTEPNKIIGYQVFNQVTVIVRDISKLGTALDAFITAGANEMYGVSFGIANTDQLTDAARDAAIKDAARKADLMAKSAGVKLGRLMSISESSSAPPVPMYRAQFAKAEASVPTAAGEQVLSADASLVYEIE